MIKRKIHWSGTHAKLDLKENFFSFEIQETEKLTMEES